MRLADRIYAVLLRCYPQEFRDEYGGEMTQAFQDGWGANGTVRRWLDLAVDVARSAPKEHALVLLSDLRYALRTLRRAPVFSAAVILTVALAIGANTAVFSVVNAVIIRPLPFEQPARLVQVAEKNDRLPCAPTAIPYHSCRQFARKCASSMRSCRSRTSARWSSGSRTPRRSRG